MRDKINTNSIPRVSYFTHVYVYTSDKCLHKIGTLTKEL